MKIWFDISNSPQVMLFKDMLDDLQKQGHDILVTSRPLANTIDLLESHNIPHTIIGQHYGKNAIMKIIGYPIRVFLLWKFLRSKKINLSVSQSSFHAPLVARLLNICSIYTNDNEHAIGNIPAFIFASTILLPEDFKISSVFLNKIFSQKVIKYPGVKEGIYLSRKQLNHSISQFHLQSIKPKIYIRPEPSTAQYYNGKENFLDDIIINAKSNFDITILPRNENQRSHYTAKRFIGVRIPKTILSFDEIVQDCSLFIGAGGSMTREMALMGIPTISVYQDKLLSVDLKLIERNYMYYKPKLSIKDIQDISLTSHYSKGEFIEKGAVSYQLFLDTINKYN